MDKIEKITKHLEMIQVVINRLGNNSFLLKGWSMTLVVASSIWAIKYSHNMNNPYFVFSIIFPVLGFWFLDGYFLWKERLFRRVYDEIRNQVNTDFRMNMIEHKNKPICGWISSTFSITLIIFYLVEIFFIFSLFVIFLCEAT